MPFRPDLRHDGCALVGMVHLAPLPGSPAFDGDVSSIARRAVDDAKALIDGGCDALLVENMGDVPYVRSPLRPETLAAAAVAVERVVALGHPVGVQLLAARNREALGVAHACGASFIRAEGFAYAHVADEGWIDACAGELLRARKYLGADVAIWADVQKKHAAHAVTADLSVEELAKGTAFCGADALVVTGVATGAPTRNDDVVAAARSGPPVAVGSGVDADNAGGLAEVARALIVGTFLKRDGDWRNPVDRERVAAVRRAVGALR